MASSGWGQVINDLNEIKRNDVVIRKALFSVLAEQKKRIFSLGQSVSGKIGTYSTKKISISRKNQARNTGKTTFQGGYAEYKRLIGKGSDFVNLRNTDQMMMDYSLHVLGKDQYGFGFNNQFNFDKTQWMESKYKKSIFDESLKEGQLLEFLLLKAI